MGHEIFRPIGGYEGLYQISNFGQVKSLGMGTSLNPRYRNPRVLKPGRCGWGYLFVVLSKDGRAKNFRVHRLVADAFILNPQNLPEINHVNHIKLDNQVENLEWCTRRQNSNHHTKTQKTSSKHEGVCKDRGKWKAQIFIGGKQKHLGSFDSELDAADAYKTMLQEVASGTQ